MECCKKRAINNPCFIGVEKRLADGRRAMNTTHIMNLRIGLGRSDRYEKQKARNTLRPFLAEPFPRFYHTVAFTQRPPRSIRAAHLPFIL